ncbi:penicillin-binding protein activator LpoB [Burkholderia alba]|uniref:penicillin-binding protein activator LpoB n=1 Tax=Burkholderia alba TaxID=2683677 RepID=UPI002B0596D8|nr:penicillin-binding protein activator LpoB [Burkholderia alba]
MTRSSIDTPTAGGGRRPASLVAACCLAAALSACSVVDRSALDRSRPPFEPGATWTVLPIANTTETPQAGQRAAAIAQTLLAAGGVAKLTRYPGGSADETLFDPAQPDAQKDALTWARAQRIRYALTGSVTEWRYKAGVDGEPAVGLAFDVIDVDSGNVIWSAAGSRTGWSRDALSGVAQKLERELLAPLAR